MLVHVSVGQTRAEVPALACAILTNVDRIPEWCTQRRALLHLS